MKKNSKKNQKRTNRYNGYNVYGQRCEVITVKVDKDNALAQCLEILRNVEIAQAEGRRLEYTLEWGNLSRDEVAHVSEELEKIVRLRNYLVGSFRLAD